MTSDSEFGSSGFTALPGGRRSYDGYFYPASGGGDYGYCWSSTEGSSTSAWHRALYYYDGDVDRSDNVKENGFSVRCVRDD
ncbi:MAG: FISUMP domain-containing protein [bacterium]